MMEAAEWTTMLAVGKTRNMAGWTECGWKKDKYDVWKECEDGCCKECEMDLGRMTMIAGWKKNEHGGQKDDEDGN